MSWAYPYAGAVLAALPLLWWVYFKRLQRFAVLYPLTQRTGDVPEWWLRTRSHSVMVAFTLALIFTVAALARPRLPQDLGMRRSEGLDIMLVVDTSESMQEQDLMLEGVPVSRLEAVQAVVQDFIRQRTEDRLGLVIFGTEAYAQAPLTLDHGVLVEFLAELEVGMAGSNTAIGDGIGVASNRLTSSRSPSRVMILLTDGTNTAGSIDPLQAAQAAKGLGIKIYTIGVTGQQSVLGLLNFRIGAARGLGVGERTLKDIARVTGGRYFYAQDTESLRQIYQTIDTLERHPIEQEASEMHLEVFQGFAWASLASWLLVLLGAAWGWGRLP